MEEISQRYFAKRAVAVELWQRHHPQQQMRCGFFLLVIISLDARADAMSARLRFASVSPLEKWRYRLGVRTEDSQSSNPGSIPGSATNSLSITYSIS
jgi:hypothetical protein